MYLRFKRSWMKNYLVCALIWSVAFIQSGIVFSARRLIESGTISPGLLLAGSALNALCFAGALILPPLLLFGISDSKIRRCTKIIIIVNPFLVPAFLIPIMFFSKTIVPDIDPNAILITMLPLLISLVSMVSIFFQLAALRMVIKKRKGNTGFLVFVILSLAFQFLTCIFSADPVPMRISIGQSNYFLVTCLFTVIAYSEFLMSNIWTLSREFSGKTRELSPASINQFSLTPRETDISNLLLKGLSSREIGEKLFITKKTVDTHIYNIYRKCGVRSKVGFFNLAGQ